MNEEEKQAIEKLDYELTKSYVYNQGISKETLKLFKDIIEKQQKEIEKLKSKKYILNAETNEIKEIPISENYISKDKIIEKIKKLETSDILGDYIGIQYLKELLGE